MKPNLKAAAEFRYLLERGYPRGSALSFVGDHNQLKKNERDVLNRGVYPDTVARQRQARLLEPDDISGRPLGLDGHNVIITLESAILGRVLIEADDGIIRDTAGLFSSYRASAETDRALDLILEFLVKKRAGPILFLLDAPMSNSRKLAARIKSALAAYGLKGEARAVANPEHELITFGGPVASGDSVLIDRVSEPFDLAGHLIRDRFPHRDLCKTSNLR